MLCQGCAARELARTSAKQDPNQEPQESFDFWDNDLAPREDLHPLHQPLPNSVWEKYAQHRELLGKPKIMLPDHLEEAEAKGAAKSGDSDPFPGSRGEAEKKQQGPGKQQRLRLWRRKKGSLDKTAADTSHGAHNFSPGKKLVEHLQESHGLPLGQAHVMGSSGYGGHADLHDAGADHTHGPKGEVVPHGNAEPYSEASGPASGKTHEAPHPSSMSPKDYIDHMVQHHGWTHENAKSHADAGMQNALSQHKIDHEISSEGSDHLTHTHKGAGEIPHPQGSNELTMHLMDHHNVGDWEMEGMDHHDLQDTHDAFHESTTYSGADAPGHTHPEGIAEKETTGGGDLHPPAKTMKGKEVVEHLKGEHGLSIGQIADAFKSGGDQPTDGGHGAAVNWHDEQHAAGAPHTHGHVHEEFGANGPEQLKNPSKYTNSSLFSHLLTDHGIQSDHLAHAMDGTFEGTDPSHVVHMLHNAVHANGPVKFDHTHENWSGGPKIHEGHTDVAKPFWGAPPNTAQKSLEHLTGKKSQGGHGLSQDSLDELMKAHTGGKKLLEDSEYQEAYEKVHGGLHQQGGDGVNHQHVPTIQPGVMSPEKIKKEQLKKHLHEYHGVSHAPNPEMTHSELHDSEAYAYKGYPGHEHIPWDKHGPLVQELPSGHSMPPNKNPGPDDFVSIKPFNPGHHDHPTKMSLNELANHVSMHHKGWMAGKNGGDPTPPSSNEFANNFLDNLLDSHTKTHEQLLQEHALHHASGETNGHTHEPGGWDNPLENSNAHYGLEPEVQTDTHPHVDNDHEALAHMIKHHPNVTQEHYDDWHKSNSTGVKPTMVKFHDALHNGGTFAGGEKLPKVLDGHDHADPSGPPTQISVGSHLVHEHGMSQAEVAAMTPAEFKAHHEQLHLKKSELDVGHGHEHPGGPMRDPRVILPNTHHQQMREDDKHPAVQEWYHGTGTDYEGAPKNATELQEDHGFWGNYGGGDWNNHVGTHWSSLHEMSKNFNGGGNRVIHAKLHISNPITYNSLNHMSHDAYDRLRASGHLQDDGHFEGNHGDDNGYNECCSGRLLEYAKGHHRSDGKFGLEAYRDSLRASGYDGIHVRNHADYPKGHWNAIPLSADQIEMTHGGCRGYHGDERDDDVDEFDENRSKLTQGWVHPKPYKSEDYYGSRLDHLPSSDEVSQANAVKRTKPTSNKTAEGRGDSDPYLGDRDPEDLGDEDTSKWCSHCEEYGDHDSDDCTVSKWCNVCEEHGDHQEGDGNHNYCEHCDDFADHNEEDCEKNPDNMKVEAYCPHCDTADEDNKYNDDCVHCGQKLPDWGKLQTQGKPVPPGKYKEDGEDSVAYGHASKAKLQGFTSDHELASHLYHHHKSDVSGKEFDEGGNWNEDALKAHHQWLHQNPQQAEAKGFEMDHDHKQLYGQFKKTMTPEETHAHLMLSHGGSVNGGVSPLDLADVLKMTPEQAVEAHKKAHAADDAVHWGQKDGDGDFVSKITHTHDLEGEQGSFDEAHYPKGDDLASHLNDGQYHSVAKKVMDSLADKPGVIEALHHQLHKNFGPAAQEGVGKYHVHTPEMLGEGKKKQAIVDHLTEHHGAKTGFGAKSIDELMKTHHTEHTSQFPAYADPDHTHFGGTAHMDPSGHTAETMKAKQPEPEPEAPDISKFKLEWPDEQKTEAPAEKPQISWDPPNKNKYGPGSIMHHIQHEHSGSPLDDMAGDVLDTAADHGMYSGKTNSHYLEMAKAHADYHKEHGHPGHTHYDNEPHPKEARLKTLSDLFEEVAS
jgi:hypothetical protein